MRQLTTADGVEEGSRLVGADWGVVDARGALAFGVFVADSTYLPEAWTILYSAELPERWRDTLPRQIPP